MQVKASLITACVVFFASGAAVAQVTGMAAPTPTIGVTSPLGMARSTGIGGTGIPFGATEIASPGVSPLPTIAPPAGAATSCSTAGMAPSPIAGSNAAYDGGGLSLATGAPTSDASGSATSGLPTTTAMIDTSGLSSMCGSGATTPAASSIPMSTASGSGRGVGIPLGSTEIGNLGISSLLAVPGSSAPTMATTAVPISPNMEAASSPTTASTMP
jgi:hypothetical protein